MASYDTDPEEFTGARQTIKADPKSAKRAAPAMPVAPLAPDKVGHEMASPVRPVAIYNPPADGEAHPKIARLAPAQRLDEAEAALNSANAEHIAATAHLRACELKEADALAALIAAMPAPTGDEVYRAKLAKEQAARLERAQAGLTPELPRKPTHGNSPLDIAAASRPRTSAMSPSTPLRSPIVRRSV